MDIDTHGVEARLVDAYQEWLDELRLYAPQLLNSKYSNPYYISIPEGWFDEGRPRIMVVGEEGFGIWGCGKSGVPNHKEKPFYSIDEFDAIQKPNYDYLRSQLGKGHSSPLNKSPFWNRFRRASKFGICCWTNIDKIHKLSNEKCALSIKDQRALHSVNTRILNEEIKILQPTHIVFFGWHRISLRHELPELFNQIYPTGLADQSGWKETTIMSLKYNTIPCLFLYHPNWGIRKKGYEEKVDQVFTELFQ